jgi:hypothetical protein
MKCIECEKDNNSDEHLMHTLILPIINKNNIPLSQIIIPECSKCNARKKFYDTLKSLGYDTFANFIQMENYDVVFHGTKSIETGKNICCSGYDISKRNGQSYGTGEYFSKKYSTGLQYSAQYTGVTILNIIIKTHANVTYIANSGDYIVVNNTIDKTYVLPIAIINHYNLKINTLCLKMTLTKVYYDENEYDDKNAKIIIENYKNNINNFYLMIKKTHYEIDLIKMIQTNKKTNYSRNITFA